MDDPCEQTARVAATPSRSAGRRRRLRRGVDRWFLDRSWRAVHVRRVALVTLTTTGLDYERHQGRVHRFVKHLRETFGLVDYFWWLELQRNGQLHYHLIWLNPPNWKSRLNIAWVQHAWGAERTQLRFRDGSWFRARGADYVKAYAKKMGEKAYQQDYSEVPSTIRTFACQRLQFTGELLDLHMDRQIWRYVPQGVYLGVWTEAVLELVANRNHLPPTSGGACRPPPGSQRPRIKRYQPRSPAARAPGRSSPAARRYR